MSFEGVYLLGFSMPRGALHVRLVGVLDSNKLSRGITTPTEPLRCVHSSGGILRDIITTEYAYVFLLSDRAVDALQSEGITGWTTWPVEVYDQRGQQVHGYQGFSILGRCGPIDTAKCVPATLPPLMPGLKERQGKVGFFFDPFTWDGSDIFLAENTNAVFVVERVKRLFERLKIRGYRFESAAEAENLMV